MCAIAMGTAMPRTPEPQTHGEKASLKVRFRGKAFLLICVQMLTVCAKKKKCLPQLSLPGYLQFEVYSPPETAPTEVSYTCLLDPAVYHKPHLLIGL